MASSPSHNNNTTTNNIAIIGAGLAGLTLALALHDQGISSSIRIFESRPTSPLDIGGAVMLSPNALKILDALGLYDKIKAQGYAFEKLEYRANAARNGGGGGVGGELVDTYDFGSAVEYGYPGLRVYRYILIDVLLEALRLRGVEVVYGRKFSHVVSETITNITTDAYTLEAGGQGRGVTFAFTDGTLESASLLVGADGIHSTVRKYLYPDLRPTFTGMAGITAAVPTSALVEGGMPPEYYLPVTIMSPGGAFVIAPQEPDGSEVLVGKQMRVSEGYVSSEGPGWEREFVADKRGGVEFLKSGNEQFPEFVRRAVDKIDDDDDDGEGGMKKVNKWPFFVVPRLERWTSEARRVVILGDAAHAIPPSAGQGINQAFEDVYMLALLLGGTNRKEEGKERGRGGDDDGSKMRAALEFWQGYRQERIDRVMVLNKEIDQRRMPANDQVGDAVKGRGQGYDLAWLYKPDFKEVVETWLAEHA